MIDLKPYGAFAQNTLRPLIEDVSALLDKLEQKGVRLGDLRGILTIHLMTAFLNALAQVACTAIACYTAFKVIPLCTT